MTKSAILFRQCIIPRQSRRQISTSSGHRTSTSPPRRNVPEPAVSSALKPFNDIPGPLALPMLRHAAHVLPRIGSFHHTVGLGLLEGMRDRYGDLVRLAKASRKRPVLYVFDPEMMREVYESGVTEPPRWDNSPLCQQRAVAKKCPVSGDESKSIWVAIKALLQDSTLIKSYDQAFDDIASDFTRRLRELRHAENALNEELETEIYRWALETVGMMMFGIRLGCLDGAVHIPCEEDRKPEKTSMDDEILSRCSLSKKPLEELTPAERLVRCTREIADGSYLVRNERTLQSDSETFKNALVAFDMHYSLTEHFLNQAMQRMKNQKDLKPEQVLLDKLRPLESRILPLAADALLAGVDPLAQTALSMFHQMSLHAAQQQRAHDEVHWAAASIDAGAGCPEMPYIAACATEAMRLHPATGGVVRRSREQLAVGGYEVPSGVDIVLAHGVTSKLENQWGRAKAFIPERWCSDWQPLKASRAHPMASMPFGESCPATGIVGRMLAALTTRVLDKYRLEWHGPAPNLVTSGVNRLQPPYFFVLQNAA